MPAIFFHFIYLGLTHTHTQKNAPITNVCIDFTSFYFFIKIPENTTNLLIQLATLSRSSSHRSLTSRAEPLLHDCSDTIHCTQLLFILLPLALLFTYYDCTYSIPVSTFRICTLPTYLLLYYPIYCICTSYLLPFFFSFTLIFLCI